MSIFSLAEITLEIVDAHRRADLFGNRDFSANFVDAIDRAIDRYDIGLISVDVFDTALLRNDKCEYRRFYEMAAVFSEAMRTELGRDVSDLDCFLARLIATRISYRYSIPVKGCREGTLTEIHEGMCRMVGANEAFAARTMALELEYEAQALQPNSLIAPLLDLLTGRDIPIVLLSDMYLSAEQIRRLVDQHFPGAPLSLYIYSSGDLKISKRCKLMYLHVANEWGIDVSKLFHIGDNIEADYYAAREVGARALYLPHTHAEIDQLKADELRLESELGALGVSLKML